MRENIWKNIKLGFKTNKLAVAGAVAILLLALISIFAFLYPVDPNAISATERLNALLCHISLEPTIWEGIIWHVVFMAEELLFWLDFCL